MDASLLGTRLDKYEIQAEIGRGGMGTVYRGYDRQLDRHVAVKVLAPHLLWEKDFIERFLREARSAARLMHPNIVTIHDVGQAGGWYYFVMEYLEGQTLTEVVRRRGPLPADEVMRIVRPLADALDYAHHRGLVHRDIKPDNVIVSPEGRVTLTDFGIARATQETRLTRTGMVVGTPAYMSPEQAKGLASDARTDQYSLAVVAYEMLCGQVPFRAESTLALLHKIAYDPPPPVCQVRSDMPAGVDMVLAKALAKEPGDRFARAGDFVQALGRALAGEDAAVAIGHPPAVRLPGPVPAPAGAPAERRQPPHRVPTWTWVLGGGVGVVAVLGVLALAVGVAGLLGDGRARQAETPLPGGAEVANRATDTPEPTATALSTAAPAASPSLAPTATPTAAPTPTPTPRYPPELTGRIVFTRKSVPWSNNTSEIWVLDVDSDALTQLTYNNAPDWIPAWSPDGARIAFTSNREDNYDLWVMNADGSDQKPWITLDAWDEYARWSPDGARLAFASTGETDGVWNSEIFVGTSTTNVRRVTWNTGIDEWPTWSPDGGRLACSSDQDGDMDVWIFRSDGSYRTNWTADTAYNEQPAWSPDGDWIAFVRMTQTAPGQRAFRGDVWVGSVDQSEFRRLTDDGLAAHPAWSPDGRHLVFAHYWDSTDDGDITPEDATDLWMVSVDGEGPFVLTDGAEQDTTPQWTW